MTSSSHVGRARLASANEQNVLFFFATSLPAVYRCLLCARNELARYNIPRQGRRTGFKVSATAAAAAEAYWRLALPSARFCFFFWRSSSLLERFFPPDGALLRADATSFIIYLASNLSAVE